MTDDSGGGAENAWERTIAELNRLEADLEAAGQDVVAIPAGHIAPVPPEAGDTDRFGLVHVIPGEEADAFRDAFEAGEYVEYEVFRRQVGHRLFLLTKLGAPDAEFTILLAGSVATTYADGLREAAAEEGEIYTHVQLLDGTHLGSFRHDDPSLFLPGLEANAE
ncbi:MAG: hypothetical protein ABEH59_13350 [Halobacteriales archaeon]